MKPQEAIGKNNTIRSPSSSAAVIEKLMKSSETMPVTGGRHIIGTYWALHGVPDWEKKQRRLKKEQLDGKSHVAVAPNFVADITTGHGHLTVIPPSTLIAVSSTPTPPPPRATDHMTYNFALFSTIFLPHHDHVLTANNGAAPVTRAGSILLTPALPLDKVLLVPSLSSNLLSMPQVTEQLNCVVLMYPFFVLLQDIQTQEIFDCGTKKRGLYYVDDVATSRVLRVGSAETSQHCRIWLLHCRFVHASFEFLQHLFPALFSGVNESAFQC
ncbi:unnamed protein product [Prunus armeniaca]